MTGNVLADIQLPRLRPQERHPAGVVQDPDTGTLSAAHAIAEQAGKLSPDTEVKVFNISKTDKNEIMTEVLKSRAIAVGSPTVSSTILSSVAGWLHFLASLKFKNKKAAVFGCYGWSGEGNKVLREELAKAGFAVVDENIRSQWNPEKEDLDKSEAIVKALLA